MIFLRLRLFLCLLLTATGISPAAAQDAALCGGNPVAVRIIGASDGTSLRLADGREVKLAHVIVPLPIDGDEAAVTRARQTLAEIANGKDATLFLLSDTKDRYGRISAQAVLIGGKIWLEAELLSRGIARVFPGGNDKCMKALLHYEAKARAAELGFWKETKFAVFDADAIEALLTAEGRFVVVEGTIRRVGDSRGRIYLDFGRRFTEDFTIVVTEPIRKSLISQGSDPKSWRGRRVRVRGILISWGGPAIEINTAAAIEPLD